MTDRASFALGIAAALATAALAACWQIVTRWGVTTNLHPLDVALMRYVTPAILLAPVLFRSGLRLPGTSWPIAACLVVGGGLPFGLMVMLGAQYAPTADMGVLMPGTMPLFVALLAWIVFAERVTAMRFVGFAVMLIGAAAIAAPAIGTFHDGRWRGDALFLTGSFLWAIFTIAARKSGLDPWRSAAFISFWSGIGVIPIWLFSGASRLASAPTSDILAQTFAQGVLAGFLGLALYLIAVRLIGPQRAALLGATVPSFSAIGGFLFLGERPPMLTIVGVILATIGVALAALAPAKR